MRKAKGSDLKSQVLKQILAAPQTQVWTASDFVGVGSRSALDKVLQRLVATGELRRIDRGLYDRPARNELTGKTTVPLLEGVAARLSEFIAEDGRVAIDDADPDGQTLLVFYPSIIPAENDYIRPTVRVECGAKSALDPHRATTVRPYIAEDVPALNISVENVTTIEPVRSFWDKAVIAHGLRRWFENSGRASARRTANFETLLRPALP
jgi:hypothetical protein